MIFQPARMSGKQNIIETLGKYRKPVQSYVFVLMIVCIGADVEELERFLVSREDLKKQDLLNIIDIFNSWEWNEGVLTAIKEIERRGFAENSEERFEL